MIDDVWDDRRGYEEWKTKHLAVNLPGEEWRAIPSAPDYAASNLGRIKRIRSGDGSAVLGALMRPGTVLGYYYHHLRVEGESVVRRTHQWVAETFFGPPPEGLTVNHKDLNRGNNRIENLEYISQRDNVWHAAENGVTSFVFTSERASELRRLYIDGNISVQELADRFNTTSSTIYTVLRRGTWDNDDGIAPIHSDGAIGENHPLAKLTDEKVAMARRLYKDNKRNLPELCAMFGIDQAAMSRALRGITWKHVEEAPAPKRGPADFVVREQTNTRKQDNQNYLHKVIVTLYGDKLWPLTVKEIQIASGFKDYQTVLNHIKKLGEAGRVEIKNTRPLLIRPL